MRGEWRQLQIYAYVYLMRTYNGTEMSDYPIINCFQVPYFHHDKLINV